jgi:hypothetical protein
VLLTEEQLLESRPNRRVCVVPRDAPVNKRGYAFLAFCNNDEKTLNGASAAVCLYQGQWRRITHNTRTHKAVLGALYREVHDYDILQQGEQPVFPDSPRSSPQRSEHTPEESDNDDPVDTRHSPITPDILTRASQGTMASQTTTLAVTMTQNPTTTQTSLAN